MGARGAAGLSDGFATKPVVVNGVVYTQDLESIVMAIRLATRQVDIEPAPVSRTG